MMAGNSPRVPRSTTRLSVPAPEPVDVLWSEMRAELKMILRRAQAGSPPLLEQDLPRIERLLVRTAVPR